MDLTKEVRGNESPAETKLKVAKERRRENEQVRRGRGEGGTKKEMESEEGVRPVERRTRRRGRNERGNDGRKVKEKAGKAKE